MAESQGPESAGLISELLSLGVAVWMIDRQCDGAIARFVGRKLRGVIVYASLFLDALHGGRETIREAETLATERGI